MIVRRALLRSLLAVLFVLGLFTMVEAQPGTFTRASGSITTNASDCLTTGACVILTDATRTSNGTIVLTGTWTGTVTFEGTLLDMTVAANQTAAAGWFSLNVLPNGSNTYVTTATANGQWIVPMALTGLRVRASAAITGTVSVAMAVTSARMNRGSGVDGTTVSFADGTATLPSMTFLNNQALGCWRVSNTMRCGGGSIGAAWEFINSSGTLFGINDTAANVNISSTGNLIFGVDNSNDIGASGATRPRDIFLARNLVGAAGGFFNSVLTNTAAYTAITGAGCGAATECFFAVGADGKIPSGAINAAKHRIEVELAGVYGANATDTLQVQVKLCQVSGCGSGTVVALATTGTVTMAAATAQGWSLRIGCNVFTSGASGTVDCQGIPGALFFSALTTVIVDDVVNAGTSTISTTVDEFLSASATWSSTNAANTITMRNFSAKIF